MSDETRAIEYNNMIHRLGRITTIIISVALLAIPFIIGIVFDVQINMNAMATALIAVVTVFGPVLLMEMVSYSPILGPGAYYLASITGNIMNMKLPAAISSINLSGFKQGTKEADVISMIAVGVSTLVTMTILIIGLGLGTLMLPVLQSPVLAPAFANLMPAIMGAIAIPVLIRNIKGSLVPYIVAAAVLFLTGRPWYTRYSTLVIPLFILLSIGWHYLLYKLKTKNQAAAGGN